MDGDETWQRAALQATSQMDAEDGEGVDRVGFRQDLEAGWD